MAQTGYTYEQFSETDKAQVAAGRIRQEENQHFVASMEAAMADARGDKAQAEALRKQADDHIKNIQTVKSFYTAPEADTTE